MHVYTIVIALFGIVGVDFPPSYFNPSSPIIFPQNPLKDFNTINSTNAAGTTAFRGSGPAAAPAVMTTAAVAAAGL